MTINWMVGYELPCVSNLTKGGEPLFPESLDIFTRWSFIRVMVKIKIVCKEIKPRWEWYIEIIDMVNKVEIKRIMGKLCSTEDKCSSKISWEGRKSISQKGSWLSIIAKKFSPKVNKPLYREERAVSQIKRKMESSKKKLSDFTSRIQVHSNALEKSVTP